VFRHHARDPLRSTLIQFNSIEPDQGLDCSFEHDLVENRSPPRITSGVGLFAIMRQTVGDATQTVGDATIDGAPR